MRNDDKTMRKLAAEGRTMREQNPNTNISMTPEEALILKQKDLLHALKREVCKKVAGEEDSILAVLLISLGGRLLINTAPTSINLIVHEASSAGKDYLVTSTLELLPDEWLIKRTRISETAFTYWHDASKEPHWTWDGKVFYCEDIENRILNSPVVKTLCGKQGTNTSTITVKHQSVDIVTHGKPVVIVTIAEAHLKRETASRFPILLLNASPEQTRRVMQFQAKQKAMGIMQEYNPGIRAALRHLKRVHVTVPYADKLVDHLDPTHVVARRKFPQYLDYVGMSAALHQHNRQTDKNNNVIAARDDYENARIVMLKITQNKYSIPLDNKQITMLKVLSDLKKDGMRSVSVPEIHTKKPFVSMKKMYDYLNNLADLGFVKVYSDEGEYSRRPVLKWELIDLPEFKLPNANEFFGSDAA